MAENLVNDESLNKLLETIPRRDHDKIKHLCDGLSITEVLVQGVDPAFESVISELTISKKDCQFTYGYIHYKYETISILKVLESIKRDYETPDDYDQFKKHMDFKMMADRTGKILLNPKHHLNDDETKRLFNTVNGRKTQIRKMFFLDEIEVIPSESKFEI